MILGICSICGGAVHVPDVWMSVLPPKPSCMACGAFRDTGPNIIPMKAGKVEWGGNLNCINIEGEVVNMAVELNKLEQQK